jgi:putative oxidoreductase
MIKKANEMLSSQSLLANPFIKAYIRIILFVEKYLGSLLFLIIRLWIAQVFWHSGTCKMQSWVTTLMLFKNEYKVPFLSPEFSAYSTTSIEIICPILLALGLASRLAVIPMLVVTTVIQCTYLCSNEHLYWAMLLGLILCFGPGRLSLDFLIRKWLMPKDDVSRFC